MALCFAKRPRQRRFVKRMLGDLAGQLCRRGAIERAQRDHPQQVVVFKLSKQPHERRVVLLLFSPNRPDDQTMPVGARAHEVLKPLDRVAVCPLQIVKNENERRGQPKRLRKRLEESQPLPAFELTFGGGDVRAAREETRAQSGHIGHPCGFEPCERRAQRVAFEPIGNRRVRQTRLARVAACRDYGNRVDTGPNRELFGEPGLPNPGFATNHQQSHRPLAAVCQVSTIVRHSDWRPASGYTAVRGGAGLTGSDGSRSRISR